MGIIELIIVVLVLLWLFGYFGRGRFFATGPAVSTGTTPWYGGSWIHLLLVVVVILIVLRLLGVM